MDGPGDDNEKVEDIMTFLADASVGENRRADIRSSRSFGVGKAIRASAEDRIAWAVA